MADRRKLALSPPRAHADARKHAEQIAHAVIDLQTRIGEHVEDLENLSKLGSPRPDFDYFLGRW